MAHTVVEVVRRCAHCGRELRPGGRQTQRFCDGVHRQRAYWRRREAIPETRPRQQPARGRTLRAAYLDWQRKNDLVGFLLDRHDEWEAELRAMVARGLDEDDAELAATASPFGGWDAGRPGTISGIMSNPVCPECGADALRKRPQGPGLAGEVVVCSRCGAGPFNIDLDEDE